MDLDALNRAVEESKTVTENLNDLKRLGKRADEYILDFLGKQLSLRYRGASKFEMTKHEENKNWLHGDTDVAEPIKVSFSTRFFKTSQLPAQAKNLGFNETILGMRMEVLFNFCFLFYQGYKYVDIDQVYQKGTVSYKYWQKRELVFPELCTMMIKNHINVIPRGKELTVKVNRMICNEEEVKKTDRQGRMTIFGQVCKEVKEGRPDFSNFRISSENTNLGCLKIKFKNERAVDIGGPFREVITCIVNEIETDERLSLFKKSKT